MDFDINKVKLVTFYGFFDKTGNPEHIQIPIHLSLQKELKKILEKTFQNIGLPASANTLDIFNPAENYTKECSLKLPLNTSYISTFAKVITLTNLPSRTNALDDTVHLKYYYAVFTDNSDRKLYAFHRAGTFKRIVNSKLAFFNGGLLEVVNQPIFKLDNDFDFVVFDNQIYIFRVSGFEYITNAIEKIKSSASDNANQISAKVNYLDLSNIATYAMSHTKSARLLASINSRTDLNRIEKAKLVRNCNELGVVFVEDVHGSISITSGHEYNFLCLLDRRLYKVDLVNQSEKYEATGRLLK